MLSQNYQSNNSESHHHHVQQHQHHFSLRRNGTSFPSGNLLQELGQPAANSDGGDTGRNGGDDHGTTEGDDEVDHSFPGGQEDGDMGYDGHLSDDENPFPGGQEDGDMGDGDD